MEDGPTPNAWLGMLVEILMVSADVPQPGIRGPGSLTARWESGILNEVNDRGIVASLSGDWNDPETFFPWSAILRMRVAST